LKLWQSRQLQGAEQKVELSPLLLRALQENISQTVAGARAELEAKLVASEEEAADLAHENERLTGDLDTLREQQEAAGLELATRSATRNRSSSCRKPWPPPPANAPPWKLCASSWPKPACS
jgi:hypothetical protein